MAMNNFYNQYQNPVMMNQQQRLAQMEQMYPQFVNPMQMQSQNNMTQTGINGRVIDDISNVMPNETVMDGSISVFPTRNLDSVFIRQWQNDGNLITRKYVPVTEENSAPQKQISLEDVMARLDELESKIVVSSKTEATTRNRVKKESE